MYEALHPLGIQPVLWKASIAATKSSFKCFQLFLIKLKLNPSEPGLFEPSHCHTASFTSSSKKNLYHSQAFFCSKGFKLNRIESNPEILCCFKPGFKKLFRFTLYSTRLLTLETPISTLFTSFLNLLHQRYV